MAEPAVAKSKVAESELVDPEDRVGDLKAATIRRRLLSHYDAGKRSLPWRGETDPYRIWISEVMLQQTRVDTVVPYYRRWLERFPNVETLAKAKEDEVLRVWQGLGYYSRARRLHQGARVVRERHGGFLPGSSEGLRGLPGVGEYTAGAVASIAFGEAVPAVDGNVKRVLSRLFDLPSASPGEFRALARELVDPERPGDFNQALMELGALVCVPRTPRCEACPLRSGCLALERGTVAARPAPKAKNKVPEVDLAVVVAVARGEAGALRLLLRKRPSSGLLAGMWEFPGVEVTRPPRGFSSPSFKEAVVALATDLHLAVPPGSPHSPLCPIQMETVTHVFSHLKVHYRPYLWVLGSQEGSSEGPGDCRWIALSELDEIPLPVAQGRIATAALEAAGRQRNAKGRGHS